MKVYRFKCAKLVRDNNSINIINISYKILSDAEFKESLFKKLKEEIAEIEVASNKEEYTNEICDVLDVLDAIKKILNISNEEITTRRKIVKNTRGLFKKKIYAEYFDILESNEKCNEFINQPEKYPVIKIYDIEDINN